MRFSDNPLVTGDPRLRFYAGALLETPEGLPLGTICVLDYKPRELDDNQKALLRLTARQIMKMLELRRLNATERTARERAETHAEATTARLAHANSGSELREQFIAVLGHDLRNPLASIQAGAQLVKRGKLTLDEMLLLTQGGISRMSGLIDNILDFARGRLGTGIDLARKDVLLTPVLTQVVDELRAAAPDRTFVTNIALAESVSCDPGRIGQLLSNLLGNAVVHGAHGTPIEVEARVKDGTFELSVSNAGNPIPDAAPGQAVPALLPRRGPRQPAGPWTRPLYLQRNRPCSRRHPHRSLEAGEDDVHVSHAPGQALTRHPTLPKIAAPDTICRRGPSKRERS